MYHLTLEEASDYQSKNPQKCHLMSYDGYTLHIDYYDGVHVGYKYYLDGSLFEVLGFFIRPSDSTTVAYISGRGGYYLDMIHKIRDRIDREPA